MAFPVTECEETLAELVQQFDVHLTSNNGIVGFVSPQPSYKTPMQIVHEHFLRSEIDNAT